MLTTEINKKKRKHEEKLRGLIENTYWYKNVNLDCVVNLSSKVLDRNTVCALGYGLSFAHRSNINPVQVGKSLFQLEKSSSENSDLIRGILYGSLFRKNRSSVPLRFIKAINNLKKDDSLHITKADKSNAIVIMDKSDYVAKVNDLLSDSNTYKEEKSDQTEKQSRTFHREIKKLLKNREDLI